MRSLIHAAKQKHTYPCTFPEYPKKAAEKVFLGDFMLRNERNWFKGSDLKIVLVCTVSNAESCKIESDVVKT